MAYRVFHRSIFEKNIPADLISERERPKVYSGAGSRGRVRKNYIAGAVDGAEKISGVLCFNQAAASAFKNNQVKFKEDEE